MYDYLDDLEIKSLSIRIEMLSALKKVKNLFGTIAPQKIQYWENTDYSNDRIIAISQVSQYYIFDKLSNKDIALRIFAGDVPLVQNTLKKINKRNEISEIQIEAIILEFTYTDKEKYSELINALIKEIDFADPFPNIEINFRTFKDTTIVDGTYITDIYFPCTININKTITDAILSVFKYRKA